MCLPLIMYIYQMYATSATYETLRLPMWHFSSPFLYWYFFRISAQNDNYTEICYKLFVGVKN